MWSVAPVRNSSKAQDRSSQTLSDDAIEEELQRLWVGVPMSIRFFHKNFTGNSPRWQGLFQDLEEDGVSHPLSRTTPVCTIWDW